MTIEALKHINEQLKSVIRYQFVEWSGDIDYPYWVGEYSEIEAADEDGMQEATFILTGTTRGTWLELERDKQKIKELFNDSTTILPNKNGLSICYANALIVPVEDMELKRIQINLNVKEWEVNLNV